MEDFPIYLSPNQWARLVDFVTLPEIKSALRIMDNCITGHPTKHELFDVLGGQLNIWPEWCRPIIEAGERETVST